MKHRAKQNKSAANTPANILFLPFNHQRTSERCKNQNEYRAETKTNHKTFQFAFIWWETETLNQIYGVKYRKTLLTLWEKYFKPKSKPTLHTLWNLSKI